MSALIVTGTDTGVGKTVVSAMLTLVLGGDYWKPVQSGLIGATDSETVTQLGVPRNRIIPEAYRLRQPLSPHRAAELDGVQIETESLELPCIAANRVLIVEGAGGVLVPLSRTVLQIELFARWRAPVIIVARTALGTINHTLLTIEALKRRAIAIRGLVLTGEENADTMRSIAEFGDVKILGRLPKLDRLNGQALRDAFAGGFHREDFHRGDGPPW
jgi:dethiobiotin synthetase